MNVISLLALSWPTGLLAQSSYRWTGNTNNNYTNAGNWNGGTAPPSSLTNTVLFFDADDAARFAVDVNANRSVNQIRFLNTNLTDAFTLRDDGGRLSVGAAGTLNETTLTQVFQVDYVVAASHRIDARMGGFRFSDISIQTGNTALMTTGTGGTILVSGVIAGAGSIEVDKSGSGSVGTVTFSGGSANTYAGNTSVVEGVLSLNKAAGVEATGNGSGVLAIGDGEGIAGSAIVELHAAEQIHDITAVTLNSDGTLNVNGRTETVGSIADAGAGQGSITLGTGALTAGGNNTSTVFSGQISGAGGAFTKTGLGSLTLSGASTYTGTTDITTGTLFVDGSLGDTATLVFPGAVLAGTGSVGGNTLVEGIHAPGHNSVGTQSFGSDLAYTSGSLFKWDLASQTTTGRGTSFDAVNATGVVSITSGAVYDISVEGLDLSSSFWSSNHSWNVFDAESFSGSFSDFVLRDAMNPATPVDYSSRGAFSFNAATGELQWAAVIPEPSTAGLGSVVFLLLLRRSRPRLHRAPVAADRRL